MPWAYRRCDFCGDHAGGCQFDLAIEQFRKVLSLRPGDADTRAGLQAALDRKTR